MKLRRIVVAGVTAALFASVPLAEGAGATRAPRPETIDLPTGFTGEGVATGRHGTFYVGSRMGGQVARGNLWTGELDVFVEDPLVGAATGLKADLRHGLLWVAGAATGQAAVYDLTTGDDVVALTLTTNASFINDVEVTRDAAYFTNSLTAEIYRVPVSRNGDVGTPQTIPLSGPAAMFGPGFNLNGIDATADGRTLVVVNSAQGTLYTIDARTGASAEIDLGGGSVVTGDGILLMGRRLLVLQNGAAAGENQVAVVQLRRNMTQGRIVDVYTNPLFETATTLARSGSTFVAVNAQFVAPHVDPEPEVVVFRLH
jgi:hypothetical protein